MNTSVVEIIKALAWPVAALLGAAVFYGPVCEFLRAIGARATKLSLFKVEVELLSVARSSQSPSLEDIKNPEIASVGDSSQMLFQQMQDQTAADYAVIDIGTGDEWLTSRLFIGSAMLERMRGVECLVFVGTAAEAERRVLAVASVKRVRWALAQLQPWLEAAFALAWAETLFNARAPAFPPLATIDRTQTAQSQITSFTGGMQPWAAANLVRRFIEMVQDTSSGTNSTWVQLSNQRMERATWVTSNLLHDLLPADAFDMWAFDDLDKPRAERAKAVLRRRAPFVALVDTDRRLRRLIDRRALLEKVALEIDEDR